MHNVSEHGLAGPNGMMMGDIRVTDEWTIVSIGMAGTATAGAPEGTWNCHSQLFGMSGGDAAQHLNVGNTPEIVISCR